MQISEEMEMVVAKGIVNNGRITPATIKSIYSASISSERCAGILRKLESFGYIKPTKYCGVFRVRVKEVKLGDKKKLVWNVPQEIVDMANNFIEVRDSSKYEDELLEKYKNVEMTTKDNKDSEETDEEQDK